MAVDKLYWIEAGINGSGQVGRRNTKHLDKVPGAAAIEKCASFN